MYHLVFFRAPNLRRPDKLESRIDSSSSKKISRFIISARIRFSCRMDFFGFFIFKKSLFPRDIFTIVGHFENTSSY